MFLKSLEVMNYRNYEECCIKFNTNKTLLVGKNAQGKTNLLESIYYLSTLASFRAKNDKELILWDKDFARIKGGLNKHDTDIDLDVWINPPKKKTLKVNGLKKAKYSEFIGNLVIVSFGVSDLLLLRGSPSDRRKWLDDSISKIYPLYKDRLLKYEKIRTQRNNCLKGFGGNINIAEHAQISLDVWDEQLVVAGSNIIYLRQKYLKEIQSRAYLKHNTISKEEELLLKYNSTISGDFNTVEDEVFVVQYIAEQFSEKLKEKRPEEIIRAQGVVGPHRDDVSFFINNIDSKSYASQGQQRTIVLSLKLAELELIKDKIGENPVLLLDDVLAELDNTRQNFLLDSIGNEIQTIITSIDTLHFSPEYLKDVQIYRIKDGNIIE